MTISVDVSGLLALASDMGASSREVVREGRSLMEQSAKDVRDEWRRNATETSGEHGKRYPKAIRYDMVGFASVGADIYPDPSMPQGDMSFEYGSVNQPPHLDGQRAIDTCAPRIERRFSTGLRFLS